MSSVGGWKVDARRFPRHAAVGQRVVDQRDEHLVQLALDELRFFSTSLKVLGVYPADPFRRRTSALT
jgi:hypothetical protein